MVSETVTDYPVHGSIDPRFAAIEEALRVNGMPTESDPGDVGASLTIIVDGTTVVDLHAGWTTDARNVAWSDDTMVNAYSTMKPVAAVMALQCVAEGLVELDAPIASWWPSYSIHGKEATTLRHFLTHQAGVPAIGPELPAEAVSDWSALTGALCDTKPWWEPGTAAGYHVNTFGFLVGEAAVRSRRRSFGDAMRDMAAPRGWDLWCGVASSELSRCADVCGRTVQFDPDPAMMWPGDDDHSAMIRKAYSNPRGISGIGATNTDRWRMASVPSTNGHTNARSVASFYDALLPQSADPLLPSDLLAEATSTQVEGDDLVLGRPLHFGLGFQLPQPERPIGLTGTGFGHYGYGGSLGFADPEAGIAFCYLMNTPGDRWQTTRVKRILEALRDCL